MEIFDEIFQISKYRKKIKYYFWSKNLCEIKISKSTYLSSGEQQNLSMLQKLSTGIKIMKFGSSEKLTPPKNLAITLTVTSI